MLTTRELINRTFRMFGAYRYGEAIGGSEINGALELLNELLASFATNSLLIPYIETLQFTMTANKGVYILGKETGADINSRKLVKLLYAAFVLDGITYPIKILSKNKYNDMARLDTLHNYPLGVLLQNTVYESILTFYPQPSSNYACIIKGKFELDQLELDDRLNEIPAHYQRFLRYALAHEIAQEYSKDLTSDQLMTYQQLKYEVENASDMDLTLVDDRSNELVGAAGVRSGLFL